MHVSESHSQLCFAPYVPAHPVSVYEQVRGSSQSKLQHVSPTEQSSAPSVL